MSDVDPNAVPGDAPVDAPVVQPDPVTVTDEAGSVVSTAPVAATDEAGNAVPLDSTLTPNVPGDDPAAPAAAVEPVVDASDPQAAVTEPVASDVVEPTAPISESATDPTADPLDSNVAEAQPDTPPAQSEDAYANALAANVAGAPAPADVDGPVVQSDDVDPRYALRTQDQLDALGTASGTLLSAVRGLAVAGLTRGQLADTCTLAIEQLYVERRDALVSGNDDPYPTF